MASFIDVGAYIVKSDLIAILTWIREELTRRVIAGGQTVSFGTAVIAVEVNKPITDYNLIGVGSHSAVSTGGSISGAGLQSLASSTRSRKMEP